MERINKLRKAIYIAALASISPALFAVDADLSNTYGFPDQDGENGSVTYMDGDNTLALTGNRWRSTQQKFDVTSDSFLEFEFRSNQEGEIHGIGFSSDDRLYESRIFKLFGSQAWGVRGQYNYTSPGAFQTFRIPVGNHFTGRNMSLVLVNDQDSGDESNDGYFRNVRLVSGQDTNTGGNNTSSNNVFENISGTRSEQQRFTFDIPAGSTNLAITTTEGSGDADLYVSFGTEPTRSSFECRSWSGDSDETCEFAQPSAGKYHVMIHAYRDFSGVTLKATYQNDGSSGGGNTGGGNTGGGDTGGGNTGGGNTGGGNTGGGNTGGGNTGGGNTGGGNTGGGNTGGGNTGGGTNPTGPLFEQMTDANCTDGMYQEQEMADPSVDISHIMNAHNPNGSIQELSETALAALDARYPFGAEILRNTREGTRDCLTYWMERSVNIWDDLPQGEFFQAVDLSVHECGHSLAHQNSQYRTEAHPIAKDVMFICPSRGYRGYPALSNLQNDKFSPAVPNNSYDSTYIDVGSPVGDQGWESVMDEAVQYSHSLAVAYAFHDYTTYGSGADGALSFVWYIQRYLYFLRNNNQDIYNEILANDCWRDTILTLWGRVWKYESLALEINESPRQDNLTSQNTALFLDAIRNPELMAEIQAVRDAQQCR